MNDEIDTLKKKARERELEILKKSKNKLFGNKITAEDEDTNCDVYEFTTAEQPIERLPASNLDEIESEKIPIQVDASVDTKPTDTHFIDSNYPPSTAIATQTQTQHHITWKRPIDFIENPIFFNRQSFHNLKIYASDNYVNNNVWVAAINSLCCYEEVMRQVVSVDENFNLVGSLSKDLKVRRRQRRRVITESDEKSEILYSGKFTFRFYGGFLQKKLEFFQTRKF